ncbi:MAG: PEP-CTERM motif protein [uncultured Sulfurovum sp.]|uniref:PEP-CTERM motif protein n=1 Tax=uncultured Sulfurovum sp. TaxID=269237 RepID=A0A6S6SR90_9BACT|nr:MAG: PEP-CTERM motif protein [uncultured Sulfurovum sp.]
MVIHRVVPLLLILFLWTTQLSAWRMEADSIVVNNTVTHINFRQSYETAPLVFILATDEGSDSATIRVNNITTTGFDVYVVEPDGNNGPHEDMNAVPYIAIEEGNHEFPDGTKIVAQKISTNKFQSKFMSGTSWEAITLSGFNATPTVLGEIQTRNSERTDLVVPSAVSQPWVTTAISRVTSAGFSLAIERSEVSIGTLQSEDVAYLAIESGLNGGEHYFTSNGTGKIEYESIRTSDSIRGWDNSTSGYTVNFSKTYTNPMVVANKNTRDGVDGGWLRRRNISTSSISIAIDEDISHDTDRGHTHEIVGVLLFSEPFDMAFEEAIISLDKNSCVVSDVTNGVDKPKRIPSSTIRYAVEVKNEGASIATNVLLNDSLSSEFDETSIKNLQIQSGACDCLGVSSASNNGANGTADGVSPIILDFGDVLGGSVATPTKECGYFEVELR